MSLFVEWNNNECDDYGGGDDCGNNMTKSKVQTKRSKSQPMDLYDQTNFHDSTPRNGQLWEVTCNEDSINYYIFSSETVFMLDRRKLRKRRDEMG